MRLRWRGTLADLMSFRGFWLAVLCGAVATLALPPLSWLWCLPLAWSPVYYILMRPGFFSGHAASKPRSFLIGWGFGLGYFAAGLYWVSYAFLVEPEIYGWLIPFALIGLGAGLGLFTGAAFWLTRKFKVSSILQWVFFAIFWTALECVRGWILTGFPWNTVGVVWAPFPVWAQGAAYVGMYGLSLITILTVTAPAAGVLGAFGGNRGLIRGCAISLCFLLLQGLGGWIRIPVEPIENQSGVKLRLVQPNIAQVDKWVSAKRYENILDTILMSQATGWSEITHVIWPETAMTYPLSADGLIYRKLVSQAVPKNGWLLTGAPRRTPRNQPLQIWNSIYAIDSHGAIGDIYDKSHLVPFGEYVPFGAYIPLTKLTVGRVDFTAGMGPRTVKLPGTPAYSPLVCYEIIFPDQVVDENKRPDWILNVTNDGWFGLSTGPYQHFAFAVLRAIEQGLPVVRAANTGISGVVDPYGIIRGQIDLGQRGILDIYLPQPLVKTIYSSLGVLATLILAFAIMFSACILTITCYK